MSVLGVSLWVALIGLGEANGAGPGLEADSLNFDQGVRTDEVLRATEERAGSMKAVEAGGLPEDDFSTPEYELGVCSILRKGSDPVNLEDTLVFSMYYAPVVKGFHPLAFHVFDIPLYGRFVVESLDVNWESRIIFRNEKDGSQLAILRFREFPRGEKSLRANLMVAAPKGFPKFVLWNIECRYTGKKLP